MKKIYHRVLSVLMCILWVFAAACGQGTDNESVIGIEEKYYSTDDFQTIVIGQSTFQDVCAIAPAGSLQVTSYGGMCKYPMEDGKCICIKFYGDELVVGEIQKP